MTIDRTSMLQIYIHSICIEASNVVRSFVYQKSTYANITQYLIVLNKKHKKHSVLTLHGSGWFEFLQLLKTFLSTEMNVDAIYAIHT
jgi:hypothetical protein